MRQAENQCRPGRFFPKGRLLIPIALAAMVISPRLLAQTGRVSGAVHDPTGAAIAGARVRLQTSSSAATTLTDSHGNFSFSRVGAAQGTLIITAQGMQTVRRSWSGASANLEITLRPQAVTQQIVVTATRTMTRLSDTPTSVILLSRRDLQSTPNLMLDDALRQIPGFSTFRRSSSRTANPTTEGVSLRGLGASGSSRVLVLENGIPLNDPFGGWVYWDRIPSESISSVEVDQEGASSLYGSNALGGIVQVLTRHPPPPAASLEVSYGNQKTPDLSFWGGNDYKGWQTSFATELFHTDGYFPVPQADRGQVDTKANVEFATTDLTVGRQIGQHDYVFARGWYLNESRDNGTVLQVNSTTLGQGALGADLDLGGAGRLSLRFYGDFQHYFQTFSSVALNRNTETLVDRQTVPSQGGGGSAEWTRSVGSRQTLVAGFDEHEEMGRSDERIGTVANPIAAQSAGGRQRTTGVFGEDLIQMAPKWLLGLSARYDHWRNFAASMIRTPVSTGITTTTPYPDESYDAFSPRVTLVHQLTERISWSASIYRAFRAPTLNELYRGFRVGSVTTSANPNLRAERLNGGETGLAVQSFHGRLFVRGTFFYNEVIGPIANVPLTSTTAERQNLGRTRAPGFEIDATARITRHFGLSGGYQYVDSTVVSAPAEPALVGSWVAQVPHSAVTFQARYSDPKRVDLSVDGNFVGKQYDTTGAPLGHFFVLDAMASRKIGGGISLFVAAENLFNQAYFTAASTATSPPELGLPITARVGFRFDFPRR
ncbi:MAG TPA: TonB-dependent receptor [Candidatus Dormibacteraeota bacterium]|nr:TonB-dependent receptor [Candidatus Dormibacteraeota bacterium]